MRNISKLVKWIDPFVAYLLGSVVLATLLPCSGGVAVLLDYMTDAAIVLLFFFHGAKLSRQSMISGMLHWKLHACILAMTYILFPAMGMVIVHCPWIALGMRSGLLYVCLLPSTVQSSIAFTSLAKGNVSAAVCAATLSNILGIFITPALVAMLMQVDGQASQVSLDMVQRIAMQLLLPFVVGHLARPWIGNWIVANKALVGSTDRCSILLVVYTVFSQAVIDGLWSKYSTYDLLSLIAISLAMLAVVFSACWWLGRRLRFVREDVIALLFCGSKKSMATGVPMASVLFGAHQVGLLILPLMIFHQVQLIVCAMMARKLAPQDNATPDGTARSPS
jgi:sodium/bile acid cotransporter 7